MTLLFTNGAKLPKLLCYLISPRLFTDIKTWPVSFLTLNEKTISSMTFKNFYFTLYNLLFNENFNLPIISYYKKPLTSSQIISNFFNNENHLKVF